MLLKETGLIGPVEAQGPFLTTTVAPGRTKRIGATLQERAIIEVVPLTLSVEVVAREPTEIVLPEIMAIIEALVKAPKALVEVIEVPVAARVAREAVTEVLVAAHEVLVAALEVPVGLQDHLAGDLLAEEVAGENNKSKQTF